MARNLTPLREALAAAPLPGFVREMISHDLSNPLAAVKANLDFVIAQWKAGVLWLPDDIAEALVDAQDAAADLERVGDAIKTGR
jgi:hypothetical protein